jgi:TonB family protein
MKSILSRRQQTAIITFTLLLHFLLLMSMFMMQLHQQEMHDAMIKREPIITIQEEEQVTPITIPVDEWVSIKNLSKETLGQKSSDQEENSDTNEPQGLEQLEEPSPSQQTIDEAVQIAQQVLGMPDATSSVPNIEITPSEKAPDPLPTNPVQKTKPALSFAQLAQGFKKHIEQSAAIEIDSDKSGIASIKQLTYLNYMNKILDCIDNSYKTNTSNPSINKIITSHPCIQLTLNRNGSIHSIKLLRSSGNNEIDRFVLQLVQDATFPPLPTSLSEPCCIPPITFFDRSNSNEHSRETRKLIIRNNKFCF